jgi:hypothetical protein
MAKSGLLFPGELTIDYDFLNCLIVKSQVNQPATFLIYFELLCQWLRSVLFSINY